MNSTRRSTKAARFPAPITNQHCGIGKTLSQDSAQWLSAFDAVISPPATGAAPEGLHATGDAACCTLWSLVGYPAITIPIGRAPNGLPLGMQIAASAGADDALLGVAAWCEAQLPFA